MPSRRPILLIALAIATGTAILVHIMVGSVTIPAADTLRILAGHIPAEPDPSSDLATYATIIRDVRLPRAVCAVLAGAALAASGLLMQTFFRNPLAGPFVLGINSGASLGVALVLMAGSAAGLSMLPGVLNPGGPVGMAVAACLGAAGVLVLVLAVARRVRSNTTLLILGLLFGYASGSLVSVLMQFGDRARVHSFLLWTFGSFAGVTWPQLAVFAPVAAAGLAIAALSVKPLNALTLGEATARTMGVHVGRMRFVIVTAASLLAGVVTAFCGPVAFVGIAVPHLVRTLFATADHRWLLPGVVLAGALAASVADIAAQVPGSQYTLPLNAVTALVGTPVVMWVILRGPSGAGFE